MDANTLPESWRAELYQDLAAYPIVISQKREARIAAFALVDDAMVERALASKYDGSDWIYTALSNCGLDLDEKRSVVRAALIAALQPGKE